MLQRAASNAYSWWWASHIRTKQSKWLEQNLQDMEDKVQTVLKILEEDGDSFAKRAEMYYKKRPELISFVEEAYRAYRSLAERYDHISTELQNANSTIATVFPERVQFPLDDEEDYNNAPPQFPKVMPNPSTANNNIPKVPTTSTRDLKGLLKTATRELKTKRPPKVENKSKNTPKSGLSKSEAIEEIDRLEKEILALQTVKEFVKSSYESGLKKHWEIENQITDLQERVFSLEDEFKVGRVIEDDEARTIMAEAALKSCQEMLAKLHEKQEISSEKAKAESERVENARGKLKSLKKKLLPDHEDHVNIENEKEKQEISSEKAKAESERVENARGKLKSLKKKLLPDHEDHVNIENEKEEAQMEKKKIAEVEFLEKNVEEMGPKGPLTVTGLVDKIDELVNEVISLETAVSSQTALLDRLRTETDDLQAQVRALEGDKVTLVDDRDSLNDKLKEMEEKLKKLEKLNQNVENENKNLNNHFVGAHSSHDFLSDKLYSVRPDEEIEQEDATLEAEEKGLKEMKNIQHLKSDVADEKDKPVPRISADNQTQKDGENKILNKKNLESAVTKEEDKQDHDSLVDNKEGLKSAVTTENDKQVSAISEDIAGEKASQILINNGNKTESFENQEVSKAADDQNQDKVVKSEPGDVVKEKDDDMNWQEMLLNGLEDREKVLLTEYTAILRNFKEVKKQLTDVEKKKEDSLFEMTLQLREQKVAVSRRDQEIRSLRQKLNLLQDNSEEMKDLEEDSSLEISSPQNEEITKWMVIDQSRVISPIEEKLRTEIDALLDQNLDFWLRFSTSFHQIQKYRNGYEDLQAEIKKIKEKGKPNRESSVGKSNRESSVGKSNRESSSGKSNRESSAPTDIRSELRPIYRHLTEIQTELTVWIDQSALLRDELQRRFSSLCNIQEDITTALKAGAEEEEMRFTSHEAAKFQGEVVNMKQENYKVRDELEAGLEHVTALQHEIRKTVADLIDELGLSGQRTSTSIFRNSNSRSRVPLRSFIFGSKAKRKSLFACMHPKKIQEI